MSSNLPVDKQLIDDLVETKAADGWSEDAIDEAMDQELQNRVEDGE